MDRDGILLKNTIIYFIGSFSSALLSFILLPLYTRFLSPEDYGKVDVIFALAFVVIPIITVQVGFACYRYLFDSADPGDQAALISNSLAVFLVGNVIFSVLYLAFLAVFPLEFGLAILLFIVFGGLALFLQTMARGLRENTLYSVLGVISTLVMLAANLVFIVGYNMKSIALLLAPVCGNIAVIVIAAVRLHVFRYIDFTLVDRDKIRTLFSYSAPLVPDAICWWLLLGFGRVYLNYQIGPEAVGIFAVANKFPSLLTTFYGIFNLAWKENAITQYDAKDRDAYYSAVYNQQAKIILGAIIVLLPTTRLVIEFLLGEAFRSAYEYIPLLFVAAALSMLGTFWGSGFESAKKTGGVLISTLWALAVNLVCNFALVPSLAVHGVVLANVAAYAAMFVSRVKRSREYFTITTDKRTIVILMALSLIFGGLYYSTSMLVHACLLPVAVVIFLYFNRAVIKKVLSLFGVLLTGAANP